MLSIVAFSCLSYNYSCSSYSDFSKMLTARNGGDEINLMDAMLTIIQIEGQIDVAVSFNCSTQFLSYY